MLNVARKRDGMVEGPSSSKIYSACPLVYMLSSIGFPFLLLSPLPSFLFHYLKAPRHPYPYNGDLV